MWKWSIKGPLYKFWEQLFVFETICGRIFTFPGGKYRQKLTSYGGLFSGVMTCKAHGGLFLKGPLIFEGGLLFRVYSIMSTANEASI